MSFDIEPDGDPHGECALEIKTMNTKLLAQESIIAKMEEALKVVSENYPQHERDIERYGECRFNEIADEALTALKEFREKK